MTATWHVLIDWDTLPLLFVDEDDFNEQLRDNMEWLKSRPSNQVSNTTRTTTSTSFVEMTGSSINVTSVGGNMLIFANGKASNNTAGQTVFFDLTIDTVRQGNATTGLAVITCPAANYNDDINIVFRTTSPPGAGTHAYAISWKVGANTGSALMRTYAIEIG